MFQQVVTIGKTRNQLRLNVRHWTTTSWSGRWNWPFASGKTVSFTRRTTAPSSPACSPAWLPPASTPGWTR